MGRPDVTSWPMVIVRLPSAAGRRTSLAQRLPWLVAGADFGLIG